MKRLNPISTLAAAIMLARPAGIRPVERRFSADPNNERNQNPAPSNTQRRSRSEQQSGCPRADVTRRPERGEAGKRAVRRAHARQRCLLRLFPRRGPVIAWQ